MKPHLRARAERAAGEPYGTIISAPEAAISEARAALPAFRAMTAPARPEARIAILAALANMVGKPDVLRNGNIGEQRQFWDKYHELLGHLPSDVLSRACDAYIVAPPSPGGKWFPDPGTILHLARQDEEWRHNALMLKGLNLLAKARSEEPPREPTQAELDHIAGLMGDLRKRLGAPETNAHDESNREALDWYRTPRPWARQGRAA